MASKRGADCSELLARGKPDLCHVRWLGGSACAGKSSVARLLAERHGLPVYSLDDRFPEHRKRADPLRHPGFVALMDRPPEALWDRPAAELAAELLAFHRDQFVLAAEDLVAMSGPVLAEGVGVLPALVPEEAVGAWLIACPDFRRRIHPLRGDWVGALLARSLDPAATHERWMERDDQVAVAIRSSAELHSHPWIPVNGSRSVEAIAAEVAKIFGFRVGPAGLDPGSPGRGRRVGFTESPPASSPASASPRPVPPSRTRSSAGS